MGKGVWIGLWLAFLSVTLAFGQENTKRAQYETVSFRLSSFWTEKAGEEGEWVVYPARAEEAYLELSYSPGASLSGTDFETFLKKDLDRIIDLKEGDVLYGSFSGKLFRCSYTQGANKGHCELFAAPGGEGLYFFRLLTRAGASRDCISRYYEVLSTLEEVVVTPAPTEEAVVLLLVEEEKGQEEKKAGNKKNKEEKAEEEDEEDVIVIGPTTTPGREVVLISRVQATPSPTPFVTPTPKPDRSAAYSVLSYEEVKENLSAYQNQKIQVSGRVRDAEEGLFGLYSNLQVEDAEGGLWYVTYTYSAGEIPLEEGEECIVLGTISGTEKTLRTEGKREQLIKVSAADIRRDEAEAKKKKKKESGPSYSDILEDPSKYQDVDLIVAGSVEKREKPLFSPTAEILVKDQEGNLWNCLTKEEAEAGEEVRFQVRLKEVLPYVCEEDVRMVPVVSVEKALPLAEAEIEEEEEDIEEEKEEDEEEEKEGLEEEKAKEEKEKKKEQKKEKASEKSQEEETTAQIGKRAFELSEVKEVKKEEDKPKEEAEKEGLEIKDLEREEQAVEQEKEPEENNETTEQDKTEETDNEMEPRAVTEDSLLPKIFEIQEIAEVPEP